MECRQIISVLSEYIDGIMDAEGIKTVESHLKKCDNCRRSFVSMKEMIYDLKNMEKITAPHDFLFEVNRLTEKQPLSGKIKKFFPGFFPLKIPMELTALVAAVFLVFVILFNFMTGTNPDVNTLEAGTSSADNSEIDSRLNGRGPVNLEFQMAAPESGKAVSSRDLLTVSSGSSSAGSDSPSVIQRPVEEMDRKKANDLFLSDIDMIMSQVDGKIILREHRKGLSHPEYITMEMPAGRYGDFLKRIEGMGSFSPPAPRLPEGFTDPLVLRVHFRSAE